MSELLIPKEVLNLRAVEEKDMFGVYIVVAYFPNCEGDSDERILGSAKVQNERFNVNG